jgi:hypothetical protein
MAQGDDAAACRCSLSLLPPRFFLLVLVATLTGKAKAPAVSMCSCKCARARMQGAPARELRGIFHLHASDVCSASFCAVVLVAAPPSARAAWVEDYPSGVPCGVTIPVEQCDPGDAAANSACMDVCHYGGCRRGGRCVSLGFARGRGCHCKC